MADSPFAIHSPKSPAAGPPVNTSAYDSPPSSSRDNSSKWEVDKTGMAKPSTLIQAILENYKGGLARQNSVDFSPTSSRRESSMKNIDTREAVLRDMCIKEEPSIHFEKRVDDKEHEQQDKENRMNHENNRSKGTLEQKEHHEKEKRGLHDSKSGNRNGPSTARGALSISRPESPTTNDVPNWYEEKLPVVDTRKASNPPVRIVAPYGAYVKAKPTLFGGKINCQIKHHGFVQPNGISEIDGVRWIRISCGWICQYDEAGSPAYEVVSITQYEAYVHTETANRRRFAAALCATLTKSHSLPNARRVSKAVMRHVQHTTYTLLNLPALSLDELLNALNASTGLKKNELLEFVKIGASLCSDPPKAVGQIAEELDEIISLRPTKWVTQDLNVITTNEVERRNNRFVMAAARGNKKEFQRCLELGQEVSVMHSMMNYTALHAAAEFGTTDIIKTLCDMGMAVNVRDLRVGQTPLHYAAAAGKIEVALLLLSRGSDRTIGCNRGQLPFELAEEEGHSEMCEFLKYRPPEIVHFVTLRCTETSITVAWQPPPFDRSIHSKVLEFVLEWKPVEENPIDPAYIEALGPLALENDQGMTVRGMKNSKIYELPVTQTVHTLYDVLPASSYQCNIFSRSKAGMSDPSNRLIAFTLCAIPDVPPTVEILKVTANGLLCAWLPPKRDNGLQVFLYELEIIDINELQQQDNQEQKSKRTRSTRPSLSSDKDLYQPNLVAGVKNEKEVAMVETGIGQRVAVMRKPEKSNHEIIHSNKSNRSNNHHNDNDDDDGDEDQMDHSEKHKHQISSSGSGRESVEFHGHETTTEEDVILGQYEENYEGHDRGHDVHGEEGEQHKQNEERRRGGTRGIYIQSSVSVQALALQAIADKTASSPTNNNNNNNNNNKTDGKDEKTKKIQHNHNNMWHRVIKHYNVKTRVKLIMGLDAKRRYSCRVRACNEAGFSEWSPWNQPVSPHNGVHVTNEMDYLSSSSSAHKSAETLLSQSQSASIAPSHHSSDEGVAGGGGSSGSVGGGGTIHSTSTPITDGGLPSLATGTSVSVLVPGEHSTPAADVIPVTMSSIALSWFQPILAMHRRVTAYEVQQCVMVGPVRKTIQNEYKLEPKFAVKEEIETGEGFETIQDEVHENHTVVQGLKGGGKYQFRVRPQIDGKWYSWDVSVSSEVVLIPAVAPDCPFDVQPAMSEEWELEDVIAESTFSESEEGENAYLAHKEGHKVTRLDVQHDRALIKWTSGHANGSPIISYQVFAARIREFRYEDVQLQAAIRRDASSANKETTTTTAMVGGGSHTASNTILNPSSSSGLSAKVSLKGSTKGHPPRMGSQSLLTAVIEEDKELGSDPSLATGASVSVLYPADSSSTTSASGHASVNATSFATGASVSVLLPEGSSTSASGHASVNPKSFATGASVSVFLPEDSTSSSTALTMLLEDTGITEAQLDWRDITNMGEPMGPQAFRATGLSPGTSYVFCVRQRNEKGWSAFSSPSPIIITSTVLPPGRPVLLLVNAVDAVVQWLQPISQTYLDYIVQIATLPPIFGLDHYEESYTDDAREQELADVCSSVTWMMAQSRKLVGDHMIPDSRPPIHVMGSDSNSGINDSHRENTTTIASSTKNDGTSSETISGGITLTPSPISQVFLSQLSPGTLYVVRVKVKTVGGWSSYSMPSLPFRTPSAS